MNKKLINISELSKLLNLTDNQIDPQTMYLDFGKKNFQLSSRLYSKVIEDFMIKNR